jgi:2-phospho-L-lactate/phosphoenolpyruvate guanylyltransferase
MLRTAAILPVKRFAHAKQRLGESVADPLRAQLARAMVGDVLSALHECAALDLTIVVTNERSVAAAAAYQGAAVVADSAEAGQSAAAALGLEYALRAGIERALCVPGDCPALDPAEVDDLLNAAAHRTAEVDDLLNATAHTAEVDHLPNATAHTAEVDHLLNATARTTAEVAIVPDRHGSGTNGLLLRPPDAIAPSFGPGSCARHRALADAAGIACRLERVPSLLLDIDTGADLDALRERLAGERVRAPRTRVVLGLVPPHSHGPHGHGPHGHGAPPRPLPIAH